MEAEGQVDETRECQRVPHEMEYEFGSSALDDELAHYFDVDESGGLSLLPPTDELLHSALTTDEDVAETSLQCAQQKQHIEQMEAHTQMLREQQAYHRAAPAAETHEPAPVHALMPALVPSPVRARRASGRAVRRRGGQAAAATGDASWGSDKLSQAQRQAMIVQQRITMQQQAVQYQRKRSRYELPQPMHQPSPLPTAHAVPLVPTSPGAVQVMHEFSDGRDAPFPVAHLQHGSHAPISCGYAPDSFSGQHRAHHAPPTMSVRTHHAPHGHAAQVHSAHAHRQSASGLPTYDVSAAPSASVRAAMRRKRYAPTDGELGTRKAVKAGAGAQGKAAGYATAEARATDVPQHQSVTAASVYASDGVNYACIPPTAARAYSEPPSGSGYLSTDRDGCPPLACPLQAVAQPHVALPEGHTTKARQSQSKHKQHTLEQQRQAQRMQEHFRQFEEQQRQAKQPVLVQAYDGHFTRQSHLTTFPPSSHYPVTAVTSPRAEVVIAPVRTVPRGAPQLASAGCAPLHLQKHRSSAQPSIPHHACADGRASSSVEVPSRHNTPDQPSPDPTGRAGAARVPTGRAQGGGTTAGRTHADAGKGAPLRPLASQAVSLPLSAKASARPLADSSSPQEELPQSEPGTSTEETVSSLVDRFIQNRRRRHGTIDAHLDEIAEILTQVDPVKFAFWGIEHRQCTGTAGEQIMHELGAEIQLAPDQLTALSRHREAICAEREALAHCCEALRRLRERVQVHTESFSHVLEELRSILTPVQVARFFVWVERNPQKVETLTMLMEQRPPSVGEEHQDEPSPGAGIAPSPSSFAEGGTHPPSVIKADTTTPMAVLQPGLQLVVVDSDAAAGGVEAAGDSAAMEVDSAAVGAVLGAGSSAVALEDGGEGPRSPLIFTASPADDVAAMSSAPLEATAEAEPTASDMCSSGAVAADTPAHTDPAEAFADAEPVSTPANTGSAADKAVPASAPAMLPPSTDEASPGMDGASVQIVLAHLTAERSMDGARPGSAPQDEANSKGQPAPLAVAASTNGPISVVQAISAPAPTAVPQQATVSPKGSRALSEAARGQAHEWSLSTEIAPPVLLENELRDPPVPCSVSVPQDAYEGLPHGQADDASPTNAAMHLPPPEEQRGRDLSAGTEPVMVASRSSETSEVMPEDMKPTEALGERLACAT